MRKQARLIRMRKQARLIRPPSPLGARLAAIERAAITGRVRSTLD